MGKYEEEIYERFERKFSSVQAQISYLASFDQKGGNEYERDAVAVAEQLQIAQEIKSEVGSASKTRIVQLQDRANEISLRGVKSSILDEIRERESQLLRESGKVETIYRNEIRSADTRDELQDVLNKAESKLSDEAYSRLKQNANQRLGQIAKEEKQEAHKALMAKQEKDREEREEREEKQEAEQKRKEAEDRAERIAEANRIREEALERKQLARELARELEITQREIRRNMEEQGL